MDTKFCKECDADYDWACPECPSCQARNAYNELNQKFLLAKKVIDALPKCDRQSCSSLATRYEFFDEAVNGIEFKTAIYRCDEHKFSNGVEVDELEIAPILREYLQIVENNI
jgi:hypothetical protein